MKTGIAFSAGKDSFACLFLNKDRLDEMPVIWVNTGKAYPETLELVEYAKSFCPLFVEVAVDREAQNAQYGIPADVVPIQWTPLGQQQTQKKGDYYIQSYLECCFSNIGRQIHYAAKTLGLTHLIRGQRLDESHKSTARDGDSIEGIVYLQPIETWNKDQVIDFIGQHMNVPAHFSLSHSSLDCYDCTAFTGESADRIEYMRVNHPELYEKYLRRMDLVKFSMKDSIGAYI